VVDGVKFTRNLDIWREGKACFFDTIKGFKGLEADAIILVDASMPNPGFTLQDAYVACSRAKHELFIVPTDIKASNRFISWLKD
ncbi:ATP-binding domain-containing protein, partial [Planctomycetota bacterium]